MVSNSSIVSFSYQIRKDNQMVINTTNLKIPKFIGFLSSNTIPEFRTNDATVESSGSRFQFKVQFQGKNNDLMHLYFLSADPVFMKYKVSLFHWYRENRYVYHKERDIIKKKYHTVQANQWQYIETLLKNQIQNDNSLFVRENNSLDLKFYFIINTDIRNLEVNDANAPGALTNDLENILNFGSFADVTMKSVEQIEYKVHKAVLASRSVVLKAHFEHNTTECVTNVIESHLESEVLKEVLTFLYSDRAPRVNDIPEKLLAAADYYQLTRLKSLCEKALHKKLTVENAVDVLKLAELHSASTLKKLTLDFIKDGQAGLICETESWANLESVALIKMIYKHIMADLDSDKTVYCDCVLEE